MQCFQTTVAQVDHHDSGDHATHRQLSVLVAAQHEVVLRRQRRHVWAAVCSRGCSRPTHVPCVKRTFTGWNSRAVHRLPCSRSTAESTCHRWTGRSTLRFLQGDTDAATCLSTPSQREMATAK